MINIIWDSGFKRSYNKRIGNDPLLKKKFWEAMNLFSRNPFDAPLKTHKLSAYLTIAG